MTHGCEKRTDVSKVCIRPFKTQNPWKQVSYMEKFNSSTAPKGKKVTKKVAFWTKVMKAYSKDASKGVCSKSLIKKTRGKYGSFNERIC